MEGNAENTVQNITTTSSLNNISNNNNKLSDAEEL